jgi:hypothetical protein
MILLFISITIALVFFAVDNLFLLLMMWIGDEEESDNKRRKER